jgi:hypothetical protein
VDPEEDTETPATLQPGRTAGGVPLRLHLSRAEMVALVRISRARGTTVTALVEDLILYALSRATVPPPAESSPSRRHTTYDEATRGYRSDAAFPEKGLSG